MFLVRKRIVQAVELEILHQVGISVCYIDLACIDLISGLVLVNSSWGHI